MIAPEIYVVTLGIDPVCYFRNLINMHY